MRSHAEDIMTMMSDGRERTVGDIVLRTGIAEPLVIEYVEEMRRMGYLIRDVLRPNDGGRVRVYRQNPQLASGAA